MKGTDRITIFPSVMMWVRFTPGVASGQRISRMAKWFSCSAKSTLALWIWYCASCPPLQVGNPRAKWTRKLGSCIYPAQTWKSVIAEFPAATGNKSGFYGLELPRVDASSKMLAVWSNQRIIRSISPSTSASWFIERIGNPGATALPSFCLVHPSKFWHPSVIAFSGETCEYSSSSLW